MSRTHAEERTNLQKRIHSNSVKMKCKMIVATRDEEYNPDHYKPGYAFHITQIYANTTSTVSCCIIPWHVAVQQKTFALRAQVSSTKKHVIVWPDHHAELWEEDADSASSSLIFKQEVGDFRFAAYVWVRFWEHVGGLPEIVRWAQCAPTPQANLAALLVRLKIVVGSMGSATSINQYQRSQPCENKTHDYCFEPN